MLRNIARPGLMSAMVLLMIACQPQDTLPTQAPESQTQATEPEPAQVVSDGPIEIEFWTYLSGSLAEIHENQTEAFNNSRDRITVVNVSLGWRDLHQNLATAIGAGNPPVVTMIDFSNVRLYASEGVFEPLDSYLSDEDAADFLPALLDDLTYEGEIYALPHSRSTQGLYYNKDLFREVGLDPEKPPTTWEEFREHAAILTDAESGRYGTYATLIPWYFEPLVNSWGGQMNDAECNVIFHENGGPEALQFFQDLEEDGYAVVPSNLSGGFDQQAIEFIDGRVGMMLQSTAIQAFIGDVVDFDWGFAMLPAGPGGRAVSHGGGNLAISAKATEEEKAAAWEFISYLTNSENSADFHMNTGYMPTRQSVMELPQVLTFYDQNPSWMVSTNQLEFAKPTSCLLENARGFTPVMFGALDRITLNGEDVTGVLDQAALELQQEIDAAKEGGTLIQDA